MKIFFVCFTLFSLFFSAPFANAISEQNYQGQYDQIIVPFIKSGTLFSFKSNEGRYDLSAVKFVHAPGVSVAGTILILPGRSEPWLKYGEVFYDLYQQGYNVYSYDHRGQGLSPHLSKFNVQIGHVTSFQSYVDDLNVFIDQVILKETTGHRYLIGHSMGGAIAAQYLSEKSGVFESAVLSAPMLQIDTKPYPEPIARTLAALITGFGGGAKYAPGQGDLNTKLPFEQNQVTRSRVRYDMGNQVAEFYPETKIGGPSSRWVWEGIKATHRIRKKMKNTATPFLLFQAKSDQIVKLKGQNIGCAATKLCHKIEFEDSQHEILQERDSIRDQAMKQILEFFKGKT